MTYLYGTFPLNGLIPSSLAWRNMQYMKSNLPESLSIWIKSRRLRIEPAAKLVHLQGLEPLAH